MFGIGNYSLGASDETEMTPVSVRTLQKLLLKKGISVGRTGADGIWGPMTEGAYKNAVLETDVPERYAITTDPSLSKTQVRVPKAALDAIRTLPDDPRPDPAEKQRAKKGRKTSPTTAVTTDMNDMFEGKKKKAVWPWVVGLGGGLLLLGGGVFFLQQREERLTREEMGR